MLDLGFIHALRQIAPLLAAERQTMLFSATMPKHMNELAATYLKNPERVAVSRPGEVADKITLVLAGRNARTGPNLYAIAGRQIGAIEDFRYGDSVLELGEAGTVWTEESFVGYVQDPTGWLRETLDNNRARGKMAYRVRDQEEAINIYAYLATFGAE